MLIGFIICCFLRNLFSIINLKKKKKKRGRTIYETKLIAQNLFTLTFFLPNGTPSCLPFSLGLPFLIPSNTHLSFGRILIWCSLYRGPSTLFTAYLRILGISLAAYRQFSIFYMFVFGRDHVSLAYSAYSCTYLFMCSFSLPFPLASGLCSNTRTFSASFLSSFLPPCTNNFTSLVYSINTPLELLFMLL